MTISTIIFYIVLGLVTGIFGVTFGVGGGVIVVPALTYFVAMQQKDAQGTALAIMIPMAVMGVMRYYWNPDIHLDWRIIALLGIAVIIGANIGAEIVGRVSNKTLQLGFGCFVLLVGIRMIWQSFQTVS